MNVYTIFTLATYFDLSVSNRGVRNLLLQPLQRLIDNSLISDLQGIVLAPQGVVLDGGTDDGPF